MVIVSLHENDFRGSVPPGGHMDGHLPLDLLSGDLSTSEEGGLLLLGLGLIWDVLCLWLVVVSGHSKITELQVQGLVDQNIGWLEVSVDDSG